MIIKCSFCGKEFDSPGRKNQHEADKHPKPDFSKFASIEEYREAVRAFHMNMELKTK